MHCIQIHLDCLCKILLYYIWSVEKLPSDCTFQPIRDTRYEPVDLEEYLQQLGGDIYEYTVQLRDEK